MVVVEVVVVVVVVVVVFLQIYQSSDPHQNPLLCQFQQAQSL